MSELVAKMKRLLSIFKKDTRPSLKRIKHGTTTPFYVDKKEPHDLANEYLDTYTPIKRDKK